MKKTTLIASLVSCLIIWGPIFAQSARPKGSLQVNICLPINLQNESFKGIMQGLVGGSFHYQHTLRNGLSFGAGVNYTYFEVNEFKISENVFGGMHTPAGFGVIGYEKFHSSNFGTHWFLKGGYSQSLITTNLNREKGIDPVAREGVYLEPGIGLLLISDEEMAVKFSFSYSMYGFGFNPYLLGVDTNEGYDPKGFNRNTSFLTVGFSYVHYFRMH